MTNYPYDDWYNNIPKEINEEQLKSLKDKAIKTYRVKTIKSGEILECEIYPIWETNKGGKREKKEKPSREAQKKLNQKNTVKKVIRYMNANFGLGDINGTLTYDEDHFPEDEKELKRNIANFIRNLGNWLKRNADKYNGLKLKYIYVTEYEVDESKGKKRAHHHIVTNFPDRDAFEEIWKKGKRSRTRKLFPDDFGLEGLARYISKDPKGSKSFSYSRNLKKPKITISDTKFTKRRAEKIATQQTIAQEVFEKMYKGYSFKDIEVKFSDIVSGAYLYVRMKRRETETPKRRNT